MTDPAWTALDVYIGERLLGADPALDAALAANAAAGLPPHDVSAAQGKMLELLARIQGAGSILELGTLGAYSTICLARALPVSGRLITLESDSGYAAAARANIDAAGLAELVEIRVGPAAETLAELAAEGDRTFDFIFIDADKANHPLYFEWAIKLSAPGTVIVADNVIREGAVLDAEDDDPRVQGIRGFYDAVAAEPRASATAIQTVGAKGYDGFALILVSAV